MNQTSLGFIGGGRITKIFLHALADKKIKLSSALICDVNPEVLKALQQKFPDIQTTSSCELVAKQEIVFIALHPPLIAETLDRIKESVSQETQIVSLAPKISNEKIAAKLSTKNIARLIPNATSYINEGYNPVSFSAEYSSGKKQSLFDLLNILGKAFEVEESKLEAYAIVSAMLPTFFWFQWKEIQNLGRQMGLNEKESQNAIQHTLLAAIDMFFKTDLRYDELIDLIPVKPIGEHEEQISEIYRNKLLPLFQKIKP